MNDIALSVGSFAQHNVLLAMGIVYISTILGGSVVAFISFWVSFAARLENWEVMAICGAVAAAEVSGDLLWFNLGRWLRGTQLGGWIERRVPGHNRAEGAIQKRGKRILYLSKFAYGSGGLIVFSLGWTGMKFRYFIKNSLISIMLGLPVVFLMAYGLFSGLRPLTAVAAFKNFERIFLVGIIAFFVLEWLISRAVKAVLSDKNGEE